MSHGRSTVRASFRWVAVTALAAIGGAWTGLAHGQTCDAEWLPGFGTPGGFDSGVLALQKWDPDGPGAVPEQLIVGGGFHTVAGRQFRKLVAFDGQRFTEFDPSVPAVVRFLAVHDGDLIVAGDFPSGGVPGMRYIGRWDGSSWHALGNGLGAPIGAMAVSNGRLFVAGGFPANDPARLFAQWDGAIWSAVGVTSQQSISVRTLADFGGQLYACGNFQFINGVQMNHIARWDGTQWNAVAGGLDLPATSMTAHNGRLLVSGTFWFGGNVFSRGIVAWSGTQWEAFPQTITGIQSLSDCDGTLYASGTFNLPALGNPRLLEWSNSEWKRASVRDLTGTPVFAKFKGELYVGATGFETDDDRTLWGLARRADGEWTEAGDGLNGPATCVAAYREGVIAAGAFRRTGGGAAMKIAEFTAAGEWEPMGNGLGDNAFGVVNALLAFEDDVIAAGTFDRSGTVPLQGVARWDGIDWSAIGGGWLPDVTALGAHDSALIASGVRSGTEGEAGRFVMAWDGVAWQPLGGAFNAPVLALHSHADRLYAGGEFTAAGKVHASYIVQWDGVSWAPVGAEPPNQRVRCLRSYEGDLVAGGAFTFIGGAEASHVARWDGIDWHALGPGLNGHVSSLATSADTLFASGTFDSSGGQSVGVLARWNGAEWSGFADSPVRYPIYGVAFSDGVLHAVGGFRRDTGPILAYHARWRCRSEVGDLDCNGVASAGDIGAFVRALTSPDEYWQVHADCNRQNADVNDDGVISVGDIAAFVAHLTE